MTTLASLSNRSRGHLVRRVPSRDELAGRPPIVLTFRDRQILEALGDFGILSTELLTRAFFPAETGERSSPASVAYTRLRLLWLWSYVERIELPVARTLGGRRPYLYALGPRGVPCLPEHRATGEGAVSVRRLDRLDERMLDHDLTVATFWADLVATLRGSEATLERWVSETTLRAWREQVRRRGPERAPSALADGIAEIRYPDDTIQYCLLEVDLGTETLRRFARKVNGFEDYWVSGDFREHFGYDDFEVVVVSPSERRRDHLRQIASQIVSPVRWASYRFGTFACLASEDPKEPAWVDLRNRWSSLLDPDAAKFVTPKQDGTADEQEARPPIGKR